MSLFGIDIDKIATSALEGQLKPITLTRTIEGGYDPIADEQTTTEQIFTSEGIEENIQGYLRDGLITATEVPVLILANPLKTKPKKGDRLEIGGNTYTITGIIQRDPAGATWTVKAEV